MTMTNEEIIRDYRLSKTPQKQIGILADLNECAKADIVEILKDAGLALPGNYNRKKPAPAVTKAATAPETAEDQSAADDTAEQLRLLSLNLRHAREDNEALRELVIRMAAKIFGVTVS